MRLILAAALSMTISAASAADYGPTYDEPPPVRIERRGYVQPARVVRRVYCNPCSGLPFGGLRQPAVAELPWGGVGEYCPPAHRVRRTVALRVRG